MNVREALFEKEADRYCHKGPINDKCHNCTAWLARSEMADEIAPDIEKFGRAAYWEGVNDARYADLHPKEKYATLDGQEGIDAGVVAMMEKP